MPIEFVPESRKHVATREWQVRTVLGDCISKANVISIQAPQYRQHAPKNRQRAVTSDFLDLAHISLHEEAALAANWLKDRPEGWKIQNLTLATMTGPALGSLPNKNNCRCPTSC